MARLATAAGSLDSHQPRKEPRHGQFPRFSAGTQEVARTRRTERRHTVAHDPDDHWVYPALRQDVLPTGWWSDSLRSSAPGSGQSLLGAASVAETRSQRDVAAATVRTRDRERPICLHHRRHIGQPGRQEDRKHLQHGKSETAAVQRASLRQEQARTKELPQLHDGPSDYPIGHTDSLQQALLHPRVLQGEGSGSPDYGRGGCRSHSRPASAGRGARGGARRYGVRRRSGPDRLQRPRLLVDFPMQPRARLGWSKGPAAEGAFALEGLDAVGTADREAHSESGSIRCLSASVAPSDWAESEASDVLRPLGKTPGKLGWRGPACLLHDESRSQNCHARRRQNPDDERSEAFSARG